MNRSKKGTDLFSSHRGLSPIIELHCDLSPVIPIMSILIMMIKKIYLFSLRAKLLLFCFFISSCNYSNNTLFDIVEIGGYKIKVPRDYIWAGDGNELNMRANTIDFAPATNRNADIYFYFKDISSVRPAEETIEKYLRISSPAGSYGNFDKFKVSHSSNTFFFLERGGKIYFVCLGLDGVKNLPTCIANTEVLKGLIVKYRIPHSRINEWRTIEKNLNQFVRANLVKE